jgi:hypothetical protein
LIAPLQQDACDGSFAHRVKINLCYRLWCTRHHSAATLWLFSNVIGGISVVVVLEKKLENRYLSITESMELNQK